MVLYFKDIEKENVSIHFDTKNLSFIKQSAILKKMGIKNNLFMLALYDEGLRHINPHDPNLSMDMCHRVALECKINPWYFFREVLRVPGPGPEPVRFIINRASMATIWNWLNNVNGYLTVPRQICKTVTALSITAYSMFIHGNNTNVGMFAKDSKLRTENVRRLKELRNTLPHYLWIPGRAYNTDNQETLEYKKNKTKYITFVASIDKKRAEAQGRGESLIWQHWDEFAYYSNNELSYPSAISASDTVGEIAREQGMPAAHLLTTTAGFTSTSEGKYAYQFKNRSLRFNDHFYDVEDKDEYLRIMKNNSGGGNGYVYIEYSWRQLGKTKKWYLERIQNKDQSTIDKDYDNLWVSSSDSSIFNKATIDFIQDNVKEPVYIDILNDIIMRWYIPRDIAESETFKNEPLILGLDASTNVGKDYTTITAINPRDLSTMFTVRVNQTNMVEVADLIFTLLKRFPHAVLVPERNRAETLVDILLHRIEKETAWNPFERIFNYFVHNKGSSDRSKHDIKIGSVRRQFGFKTTGGKESRSLLYGKVLMTMVEKHGNKINDKVIVDEMCGLSVRNDRVDHAIDGNDDALISYLLATWFVMYANNISLYGIDPSIILSSRESAEPISEKELELINTVRELKEKLSNENISKYARMAFEQDLKGLLPLINESALQVNSGEISIHQRDAIIDNPNNEEEEFDMDEITSSIFA